MKFQDKYVDDKKCGKFKDRCYYTDKQKGHADSMFSLRCSSPKKFP